MNDLERQRALPRLLSVIVVEMGAPWPIPELGDEELDIDRVVLAQQKGESQLGFSRRVVARLAALAEHGAAVHVGVLATHENESILAAESRDRIARALVGARTLDRTAGLVLIGRAQRGPRHDLFALASVICRSLRDDLYVRVKMVRDQRGAHPRPRKRRLSA